MFSLTRKYENPVQATKTLLKEMKVNVNASTINETLQNHPDYPSLLSISDALNRWKIDTTAIRAEKEKLAELPLPFITHTKESGGTFIAVTKISDDKIECGQLFGGGGNYKQNSVFE